MVVLISPVMNRGYPCLAGLNGIVGIAGPLAARLG